MRISQDDTLASMGRQQQRVGKLARPAVADWAPQFEVRCACMTAILEKTSPLLAIVARAARELPEQPDATMLIDGDWVRVPRGEWVVMPIFRRDVKQNGLTVARGVGYGTTRVGADLICRSCNNRHIIDRDEYAARAEAKLVVSTNRVLVASIPGRPSAMRATR